MHYEEDHNDNYENQQNNQAEESDNYDYSGNDEDSGFEPFPMNNIILFPEFQNISCESCEQLFPVIIHQIQDHIDDVHSNDELQYQCDCCQEFFEDLQDLTCHYECQHEEN